MNECANVHSISRTRPFWWNDPRSEFVKRPPQRPFRTFRRHSNTSSPSSPPLPPRPLSNPFLSLPVVCPNQPKRPPKIHRAFPRLPSSISNSDGNFKSGRYRHLSNKPLARLPNRAVEISGSSPRCQPSTMPRPSLPASHPPPRMQRNDLSAYLHPETRRRVS